MKPEFAKILIEELENKKVFTSNYDMVCDVCGGEIAEGDDFIFMGAKQKVCNECQGNITTALEAFV